MKENCRFCNIVNNNELNIYDKPIAESESFIAIASIGAFIEGWTLILPKQHVLSMKNFYNDKEFIEFYEVVKNKVSKHYGNIISFEHGPNCEGSVVGCGTDHAHVHLVPFSKSLNIKLRESNLLWSKITREGIVNIGDDQEYLLYFDAKKDLDDYNFLFTIVEEPVSQFFRKILAKILNREVEPDYKKSAYESNTTKTYVRLAE